MRYLVPSGVGAILARFNVQRSRIRELAWWDKTTISATDYPSSKKMLNLAIPAPELDWTDVDPPLSPISTTATLRNDLVIEATCCPAQHNSGRGLFDHNKTLWASWYLDCGMPDGQQFKLYFGG